MKRFFWAQPQYTEILPSDILEMRAWLKEGPWDDALEILPDFDAVADEVIVSGIQRVYRGGTDQFIADGSKERTLI